MIFSLDELVVLFGKDAKQPRKIMQIKKDFMHIRQIYRKERGFFKSLSLTDAHILQLFEFYVPGIYVKENNKFSAWESFVKDCEEGGADFIDNCI